MYQTPEYSSGFNLDVDLLVSKAWNHLCDPDEEQLFLRNCSKCYREAADMMTKLDCKWNGETFNQLRRFGFLGFTHFYFERSKKLDKSVISTLIALDRHYKELCIPSLISAFFSIEPFGCFCDLKCDSDLSTPWFYKNGIFDGKFDKIIGKGVSGIVLHGFCHGVEAAFKFVEIKELEVQEYLDEMRSVQTAEGSRIVNFYGHFR